MIVIMLNWYTLFIHAYFCIIVVFFSIVFVFKLKLLCFSLVQTTFVEANGMEFRTILDKSIRRVLYCIASGRLKYNMTTLWVDFKKLFHLSLISTFIGSSLCICT